MGELARGDHPKGSGRGSGWSRRAGPYGEIPRTLGTTSTLEEALESKVIFQSNGFTVKVQERVNDRWRDFDPTQGKL